MNNLALSESTPLNTIVYKLEGYDPEGGAITFGLIGSSNFEVDPKSGDVKLIKELDREVTAQSTCNQLLRPDTHRPILASLCRHKKRYHF